LQDIIKMIISHKFKFIFIKTLRKKIIKYSLCNGQEFAKNFENSMKDILKIK